MIDVYLSLAKICFTVTNLTQCHPALVGPQTPVGEYQIIPRRVSSEGYGGDVLQFHEDDRFVYAIHRVWVLNPRERRQERLQSPKVEDRRSITNGCVNVSPEVYRTLVDCCSRDKISIHG